MRVAIGYAADVQGRGIAYARLQKGRRTRIVQSVFEVRRHAGLAEREVGYAALEALLRSLRVHTPVLNIELEDLEIAADLTKRREFPVQLMLPYVRVRCALNAFQTWTITASDAARDLTSRARAELSLRIAA